MHLEEPVDPGSKPIRKAQPKQHQHKPWHGCTRNVPSLLGRQPAMLKERE